MTPPTRLAFWTASWVLWVVAGVWRIGEWLDGERDSGPSWWLLGVLWTILAWYAVFLGYVHLVDHQWLYGWRR